MRTIGNLIRKPISNPVGNPRSGTLSRTQKIGNPVGRGDCCEPHSERNRSFSKTEIVANHIRNCWELYQEPYRLFGNHIAKPIRNLSTTSAPKPCIGTLLGTLNLEPYTGILSETLSGTLKPLFGTLLGTWNLRPEIGNWLGTLLGIQWKAAPTCPETFTNGWRPHPRKTCFWHALPPSASPNLFNSKTLSKTVWGTLFLKSNTSGTLWEPFQPCSKPVGNPVANPVGKPCWGTLLGTLLLGTLLGTLFGNPVRNGVALLGNPVWEPCWERCWDVVWGPCWGPCLGTCLEALFVTLLRTLLGTLVGNSFGALVWNLVENPIGNPVGNPVLGTLL